jgi:hypothetical protein
MDVANVGVPGAVALPIRFILIEAGELRLQPAVIGERFRGFHPVDFHNERM